MFMVMFIFFAFIGLYAALIYTHIDREPRATKLFTFGLLVSILYASVYSALAHPALLIILSLTTFAILTQYFHLKAVEKGKAEPMNHVVDVTKAPHWEPQPKKRGTSRSRPARSRSKKRR